MRLTDDINNMELKQMEPEFDLRGSRTEKIVKRFYVVIALAVLVLFQQSYARSQECGVEQPVGLLGIAETYFRHPEHLVGLHFGYPHAGNN